MTPEERAAIEKELAEMERQKAEIIRRYPHMGFMPNPAQYRFLQTVRERFEKGIRIYLALWANGSGKTFLMSNIAYGASCAPGHRVRWFDFAPFNNWQFPKRGRIICNSKQLREETGRIWRAIHETWPKGHYTEKKQGYEYVSCYAVPETGWVFDCMCLRPDQRVTMADGTERPVMELKRGDIIATPDGFCAPIDHIVEDHADRFLRIRTRYGNEIVCSDRHRIMTPDGWKKASDLKRGDVLNPGSANIYSTQAVPEWLAYVVGMLIADGNLKSTSPRFTCHRKEVLDKIRGLLPDNLKLVQNTSKHLDGEWRISLSKTRKWNPLWMWLQEHGLRGKCCYTKRVPDIFFQSDNQSICHLLRGMFTGDGSISHHSISYTSVNRPLVEDVKKLLRRIGIPSTIHERKRNELKVIQKGQSAYVLDKPAFILNINGKANMYRFLSNVGMDGRDGMIAKLRQRMDPVHKLKAVSNKILHIESLPGGKCFDIALAEEPHSYFVDGLIVHNTEKQDLIDHESEEIGLLLVDEPCSQAVWSRYHSRMRKGGLMMMFATLLEESEWVESELMNDQDVAWFHAGDHESNCSQCAVLKLPNGTVLRGSLNHEDINRASKHYLEGEKEARTKGTPVHRYGRVFQVHDEHFIRRDRAESLWRQGRLTTYLALDPHQLRPWMIVVGGIDDEGRWFVLDEWPRENYVKLDRCDRGIREYADILKSLQAKWNITEMIIDRKFATQQMRFDANATTLSQELLIRHGLYFAPGVVDPLVDGNGVSKVQELLKYDESLPVDAVNQPRLYICDDLDNCRVSIRNVTKRRYEDLEHHRTTQKLDPKYLDPVRCIMYLVTHNAMHSPERAMPTQDRLDADRGIKELEERTGLDLSVNLI